MKKRSAADEPAKISITYILLFVLSLGYLYLLFSLNTSAGEVYRSVAASQQRAGSSNLQAVKLGKKLPAITVLKTDPFTESIRWQYVSPTQKLPKNYTPSGLQTLRVPYVKSDGAMKVLPMTNAALVKLFTAAKKDGVPLIVASAYRNNKQQTELYDYYVRTQGKDAAEQYVAQPGESEHATGLAVDINTYSRDCEIGLTLCSISPASAAWLNKNAAKYGFILRYPKGKESITGVANEPWHYRYVGSGAKTLTQSGLTFDELVKKVAK